MAKFSYNALTELLTMIEYSDAAKSRTNEELATILIEQVWAELPIDTAASAFIGEIAHRLAPSLFDDHQNEQVIP